MNKKIVLLKFFDRLIGGALVRLLSPPTKSETGSPRSILVIRPGGIGDAVHLVPLLEKLHKRFPELQLTLLVEKRNVGIFALLPFDAVLLCYDRPKDFLKALSGRYDVVIDSEQWYRLSAVVARLLRSPLKIGFSSNERRRLFTHAIPYSHAVYESEIFLSLLSPLLGEFSWSLPPGKWLEVHSRATEQISLVGESLPRRYVVVFPGASIDARRWGAERFRSVAMELDRRGWKVLVVGADTDRADAAIICQGGCAIDLTGKTTLLEVSALIAGACLLVSGDSGLLHIAAGLGTPTVSFFGPGIEEKWAPRGDEHVVLNLHLPCSPCTRFGMTPRCPYHYACLVNISAVTVLDAAITQLTKMDRVNE